MNLSFDISSDKYSGIKNNPLIFFRLYENVQYDEQGREEDYSEWQSVDRDLGISFNAGQYAQRELHYCLTIVGQAEEILDNEGNANNDEHRISLTIVTGKHLSEWKAIFNCFISKYKFNDGKKYAFLELLWALDKLDWSPNTLIECITSYSEENRIHITEHLSNIGRCLAIEKQKQLKEVCESVGGKYKIYIPQTLLDLYKDKAYPLSTNLFKLLDRILERPFNPEVISEYDKNNQIIAIYKWLYTNEPLVDYNILIQPVFSLVSEETRLSIVRRYFHDLRNKYTTLNLDILSNFRENKYSEFLRYRYCLETPSEPIVLTVPLLCDSLITLYNSKGRNFQTYDGVLDIAIQNCDSNNPKIDFKLNRILPTCENGAVYNRSFKGFVDYSIIYKIDSKKLTDTVLQQELKRFLDRLGSRKSYYACRFSNNAPVTEETLPKCLRQIRKRNKECLVSVPHDDKWRIPSKNISFVNNFLSTPIERINQDEDYDVDWGMVSTKLFKDFILSLPINYETNSKHEFVVTSYDKSKQSFELDLIETFGKKTRMRIIPQRQALVSLYHDVFGIKKKILSELSDEEKNESNSIKYKDALLKYQQEEAQEVYKRTVDSLNKELNSEILSEGYFEVQYEESQLDKILRKYYHKSKIDENDKIWEKEFLTSQKSIGFKAFCAPTLADEKNSAINLPFFWCMGKECFHNNLAKQVLSEETKWKEYTLYHLVEIMGFPMLKETEAGYEPYEPIRQFIKTSNNVIQTFHRLKCRECGHLLFPGKSLGFNSYNRYGCYNPGCKEYKKLIYLNYCYNCKTGLIDSRDSKQCPNGWYICPTCLACCNDSQYERQAQKYQLNGQPIPSRIKMKMGQGHNDKGFLYCYKCGSQLTVLADDQGIRYKGCPTCHKNYEDVISEYYTNKI